MLFQFSEGAFQSRSRGLESGDRGEVIHKAYCGGKLDGDIMLYA